MNDESTTPDDGGRHLARWIILIGLAIVAAAVGRQMAISSSDKEFEARLAELDTQRD